MTTENAVMESNLLQQALVQLGRIRSSASWFTTIAVLSVVNSLVYFFGGQITFVVGLGVTQTADGLVDFLPQIREDLAPLFFTAVILAYVVSFSLFILAGILAKKNKTVFLVASLLYVLDAVIMLIAEDWFSAAFHGFALFSLFAGFAAFGQLEKMDGGKEQLANQPLTLLKLDLTKSEQFLTTVFWFASAVWLVLFAAAIWLFLG